MQAGAANMAVGLAGRAAELLPGEKGSAARFVRGKANLVPLFFCFFAFEPRVE